MWLPQGQVEPGTVKVHGSAPGTIARTVIGLYPPLSCPGAISTVVGVTEQLPVQTDNPPLLLYTTAESCCP